MTWEARGGGVVDGSNGWDDAETTGVLVLPSGRRVRGRGLRRPAPRGRPPEFGLYLARVQPPTPSWEARWLRWPDFRTPTDADDARDALVELWRRASGSRVEVACSGGVGRTGTALACLLSLEGLPADDAVREVRRRYHPRAVETPWQRRFVRRFAAEARVR